MAISSVSNLVGSANDVALVYGAHVRSINTLVAELEPENSLILNILRMFKGISSNCTGQAIPARE